APAALLSAIRSPGSRAIVGRVGSTTEGHWSHTRPIGVRGHTRFRAMPSGDPKRFECSAVLNRSLRRTRVKRDMLAFRPPRVICPALRRVETAQACAAETSGGTLLRPFPPQPTVLYPDQFAWPAPRPGTP